MKYYKMIMLIMCCALFTASSCCFFPYGFVSRVPTFPDNILPEGFMQSSGNILVLPVWDHAPYSVVEGGSKKNFDILGKAIFLPAKDLHKLPDKISAKTSFALISLPAMVGRWITFERLYLISNNGQVLCLTASGTDPQMETKWGRIEETRIGSNWKKHLIEVFSSGAETELSIKGNNLFSNSSNPILKIEYSSSARRDIVEFIEKIPVVCEHSDQEYWQTIY
jgi:hypothetical protein